MKKRIKGSVPFFTPKKFGIVYIAALVICVILRILQVTKLIDPVTGFYNQKGFPVILFYVILAGASLFCIIGAYLARDTIDLSAETINDNKVSGLFSILLSVGFILDFIYCRMMLQKPINDAQMGESAFSSMMRSGSLPRKAEMVFAFLAAVYFLILAVFVLANKYKGQMKIVSLVTVFWGISRLVTLFVKQISFVQVSDLLLEIISTALLTLFFFAFCECLSGVYKKDAQWRIIGIGLPASLCSLTTMIPRIIAYFIGDVPVEGNPDITVPLVKAEFTINFAMIFAAAFVVVLFGTLIKTTISQKSE